MFTNVMFYVSWVVIALFPLMIAVFAPETVRGRIIACLLALAISFGVTVLIYNDAKNADKRWNNGVCECGGTYEFSAASKYRTSESFYYTCDTCGHTEEFSHLMR